MGQERAHDHGEQASATERNTPPGSLKVGTNGSTECHDGRVTFPAPGRSTDVRRDPAGTVRLWLVDLDVPPDRLVRAEQNLTLAERARARRGTAEVHRHRVVLRACLRRVLAAELDLAPEQVPLRRTAAGRPELLHSELDVSCSSDGDLGLVAVATGVRVGVDVERVAAWDPDAVAEGWLSPGERAALMTLPPLARPAALTGSWTQKEAVLKGRGAGLAGNPATVSTTMGATFGRFGGWDVRAVAVPPGRMASVASTPLPHRKPPAAGDGPLRPDIVWI